MPEKKFREKCPHCGESVEIDILEEKRWDDDEPYFVVVGVKLTRGG